MGTNETANELNATLGGYEHIVEKFHLALANWEMIRTLVELEVCRDSSADWLDSLIVSMDFLKREAQ
jgi:hypothetical protein